MQSVNYPYQISVCIPVYNTEQYIRRCLESLFSQTIVHLIEIILVDDCSQDNSIIIAETVIKEYPKLVPQISIIRHTKNKGPSAARNTALSIAKGKYILFVDSDDYVKENYIEKLYKAAEQNIADITVCNYILDNNKRLFPKKNQIPSSKEEFIQGLITQTIPRVMFVKLIRTDLFKCHSIKFNEDMYFGEDFLISIQLLLKAEKFVFINDNLYYYNIYNTTSICHNARTITQFLQREKTLWTMIEKTLDSAQILNKYLPIINKEKAQVKINFYMKNIPFSFKKISSVFPESDVYIKHQIEQSNWTNTQKIKLKLIQSNHFIFLHFWLFCKTIKDYFIQDKTIYIASLNGISNMGGLEKVNQYLFEILKERYPVQIISKREKPFKHGNWLLQPLYICIQLLFKRNKFVIGNSWHSFLYPCDISLHHGTMYGISLQYNSLTDKSQKRIARLEKISGLVSKKIIAVSQNVKRELIEYYKLKESKITILNNFVDNELFFPVKNSRETKIIKILFCGRLDYRKGIEKLVMLSNHIEQIENFELHIATVKKDNTSLFAQNKKTFINIGISFANMPDFYRNGDILYFPTLYEGFSMATLEALSSGLPVIGSQYAIMPELEHFPFVYKTASDDMHKLISVITSLVSQFKDKKEYIHNCIAQEFGKKQYANRLLAIIDEQIRK